MRELLQNSNSVADASHCQCQWHQPFEIVSLFECERPTTQRKRTQNDANANANAYNA
jgi:hypothetical protein